MTGVVVRPAVSADAALIAELVRELAAYERLAHEAVATEADFAAALFGSAPRAFCDVAELDGEPVGLALWFFSFSTFVGRHGLYLEDLFVRPRPPGPPRTALPRAEPRPAGVVGARLERARAGLLPRARGRGHGRLDRASPGRSRARGPCGGGRVSRVAYVEGRYVPHARASVGVEDRGFQFADGVYEVWSVFGGRLADADGHFARLSRSLGELSIAEPMPRAALDQVLGEVVRRNRIRDGLVYLQVTRGRAPRDHAFPNPAVRPTLVVTAKRVDLTAAQARAAAGVAVVTTPETRWARCDIKTVGLLPNVLAKQAARAAGAYEAWFVDRDGLVTEGASTNAWIVTADGVLVTRDTGANILRGVTRAAVAELAESLQMRVEERAFTVVEAQAAREAFITAATAFVTPVTAIDGAPVGEGAPGPVALRLRGLYLDRARA